MNDLVSIIIGTYERYDLVLRAIESALNQTYNNIEVIVVDDCSKDDRYKLLESRKDIIYLKTKKNSSLPAIPRNMGIIRSSGKWISFLDDDDYFVPSKIEDQMEYSKSYDFICSDAFYDNTLNSYAKGLYLDYWNKINPEDTDLFDINLIKKHNLIINSSVLVKKEKLIEIGLLTTDVNFRRVEDYHTWLTLLSTNVNFCKFVDKKLLYYNMNSVKY
jgi:glycosyltransferase involved in cell wall biosynthesis